MAGRKHGQSDLAPARANHAVHTVPVNSRANLEKFIKLPWSIYRDDPNWVAPLLIERRGHLNRKANPFFQIANVRLWLALRDGRAVGRISSQVNHASLQRHQDATGHFGMLEAEDDPETFAALFRAAENWLTSAGMRRIRGPFSLSINEESGLLVDGFDTPPSVMMGHAKPYYGRQVEALGYVKAKDLIAYDFKMANEPVSKAARAMVARLEGDPSITIRELRKSRFAEELRVVLHIFNDAWSENWGFVPLSDAEIDHLGKEMKPLIRKEFVCIVEVDGRPAAFGVSLPNLNEAIADLNGKLLPFGWAKLLFRLKAGRIRTARLPLMGVRRKYHGGPLGAVLAYAVIDRLHRNHVKLGFEHAELSWILEDNVAMRKIIEASGATPYKTYRVYQKDF